MRAVFYSADSRGYADHGWLKSYHSFSFANYFNPEKMNFGALRVLNDDYVEGGMGFGKHPHDNMEIISIPLEGDLEHGDSMGNSGIIRSGDVQVMSAGTGVIHSEMNASPDKAVKFLQIWVIPRERDVTPRYDQISIENGIVQNGFQQIVSPYKEDAGVWIHQDAWFNVGNWDAGIDKVYNLHKPGNGVYIFVLEGQLEVHNQVLNRRDALGIVDASEVKLQSLESSRFLIIEVPMA